MYLFTVYMQIQLSFLLLPSYYLFSVIGWPDFYAQTGVPRFFETET